MDWKGKGGGMKGGYSMPMGKGMMPMLNPMQMQMMQMQQMQMRPMMGKGMAPMGMMGRPGPAPMPMTQPAGPRPGSAQNMTPAFLASAPPGMQKQILGERLYTQINKMCPDMAGKIT